MTTQEARGSVRRELCERHVAVMLMRPDILILTWVDDVHSVRRRAHRAAADPAFGQRAKDERSSGVAT